MMLSSASNGLISSVKYIFQIFGLKISRSIERYHLAIKCHKIDLIFDIGANSGQFAKSVFGSGYRGTIVSFEPTSEAYNTLKKQAKYNAKWEVHDRVALGDRFGQVDINVADNSGASSSILDMGLIHKQSAPGIGFRAKEQIALIPFDSVFGHYVKANNKCMLKLDVQGYEHKVLLGAEQSLEHIYAVKLECSLVSLYEGEATYDIIFGQLISKGFYLYDIEPGFYNKKSGQLLQFDALFLRKD